MKKSHIDSHFDRFLLEIREKLLTMAASVEKAIYDAIRALVERDSDLARQVIQGDKDIDAQEVALEERCIRLLAMRQPMASDLRFVATAIKINADLERIADNAVNIAERALELNQEPMLKPYIDIPRMSDTARSMLRDTLDAFVNQDADMAIEVIKTDEVVDDLNSQIFRELLTFMMEDPHTIPRAIRIMFVSKYLERIADHATNIAEMVVFMATGRSVRHEL
ncbi:MAG: phosphate signaling complex protein PhoU [Deltaproteobacteria bacterium]|nr:phosphate signaling complex protein PhoU [Deltaproteobacteria bacterium]MBW2308450.1 phosphate signaling complex protein PhoU [Deltaproteobacteria bacterium]